VSARGENNFSLNASVIHKNIPIYECMNPKNLMSFIVLLVLMGTLAIAGYASAGYSTAGSAGGDSAVPQGGYEHCGDVVQECYKSCDARHPFFIDPIGNLFCNWGCSFLCGGIWAGG
jgi:hypothetical protein